MDSPVMRSCHTAGLNRNVGGSGSANRFRDCFEILNRIEMDS